MNDLFKKSLAAVVIMFFIATSFGSSVSGFQKIISQDLIDDKQSNLSEGKSDFGTFMIKVEPLVNRDNRMPKFGQMNLNWSLIDNENKYEIQLPIDDIQDVLSSIDMLDSQIEDLKDLSHNMIIYKEKIKVLRDAGILPSSFTMENLTKTAEYLRDIASNNKNAHQAPKTFHPIFNNEFNPESNDIKPKWGLPYIGFGTVFICFCPLNVVTPLPVGPLELRNASSYTFPIFNNRSAINFTIYYGVHYFEVLIAHSITFGFAKSIIPFKDKLFAGSFYSIWGPNAGISLTVYYMGPPIIPLLDISLWGGSASAIIPFWFEMPNE